MKKPTPAQVRKFRNSEEYFALSGLADCGYNALYDHIEDWEERDTAREVNLWKVEELEEVKRSLNVRVKTLRDEETVRFESDRSDRLLFTAAEQNADDTAREGAFEEGSIRYLQCVLGSFEELMAS